MSNEAVKAAKAVAPKKAAVKPVVKEKAKSGVKLPEKPAAKKTIALSFKEFCESKWKSAGAIEGFFNNPHCTDHHGLTGSPNCPNCDTSLPRFKELYEKSGK